MVVVTVGSQAEHARRMADIDRLTAQTRAAQQLGSPASWYQDMAESAGIEFAISGDSTTLLRSQLLLSECDGWHNCKAARHLLGCASSEDADVWTQMIHDGHDFTRHTSFSARG